MQLQQGLNYSEVPFGRFSDVEDCAGIFFYLPGREGGHPLLIQEGSFYCFGLT
jgi:hypothetical protein